MWINIKNYSCNVICYNLFAIFESRTKLKFNYIFIDTIAKKKINNLLMENNYLIYSYNYYNCKINVSTFLKGMLLFKNISILICISIKILKIIIIK